MGYHLDTLQWSDFYYVGALLVFYALVFLLFRATPLHIHFSKIKKPLRHNITLFAIVSAAALLIYFNFITGSEFYVFSDIGSDTRETYLPFYVNTVENIASGQFGFWNADAGLGLNTFAIQLYLLDPFAFLLIIPGGILLESSAIPTLLLAAQIIKIYFSVFLCNKFLEYFKLSPAARIIASFIYGFSGFLMLWGSHYWFGTACVLLIALLVAGESILARKTPARLVILSVVSALVVAWSVYLGFMIMLFFVVYVCLRAAYLQEKFSVREYARNLFKIGLSVLLGCVAAGAAFLPGIYALTSGTSRIGYGSSTFERMGAALLDVTSPIEWFVLLGRTMSNNMLSTGIDPFVLAGTNYYEFPQLATTVIVLICAALFVVYVVKSKETLSRKIVLWISTVLVLLYCADGILPFFLYAGITVNFRSSFVIIVPLVIMIAIVWTHCFEKKEYPKTIFLGAAAISAALIIASVLNASKYARFADLVQLGVLVLFVVAALFSVRSKKTFWLPIMMVLVIGGVTFDAFVTTNIRNTGEADTVPMVMQTESTESTEQALTYIEKIDNTFYRVEKTYVDITIASDALLQNYHGMTSYNSSLAPAIIEFYTNLWPSSLSDEAAHQKFKDDPNQPELAALLNIKYILSHETLEFPWVEKIAEFGTVLVYKNIGAQSVATQYYQVVARTAFESLPEAERKSLLVRALVVDDSLVQDLSGRLSDSAIDVVTFENNSDFYSAHDDSLYGFVDMKENGYTLLAIPDVQGWQVFVDGVEVETFRADYGFISFAVPEGRHLIEARYVSDGFLLGLAISTVGIIAIIARYGFVRMRCRKMKKTSQKPPRELQGDKI